MSAHSRKLTVTRNARRDLAEIRKFSLEHWGEGEALNYVRSLRRSIESLLDNPELGVSREALGPHVRGLTIGQHRIIYRLSPTSIRVLRVIHQRRDETRLNLN